MKRTSRICCRELPSLVDAASPFARIVALGYYDGPTSGVAECEHCPESYRFDMLAWDVQQDVRVYSLSALPPNSVAELVKCIPAPNPPHWPVWVPTWRFGSREKEEETQRQVARVLSRAGPVLFVIASEDLAASILRAKQATPDDLTSVTDWFSFVGLKGTQ